MTLQQGSRPAIVACAIAATAIGSLVAHAKPAPTPEKGAKRAQGSTFSVPIPAGFAQTRAPEYEMISYSGGVMMLQTKPKVAGGVKGSIAVTPVRTKPGYDATDPKTCEEMATAKAKVVDSKVVDHGIVAAAYGRTCQFSLEDEKETMRGSRLTVVYSRTEYWAVTCTYDLRDPAARNACKDVVAGWLFT